jgi:transposase
MATRFVNLDRETPMLLPPDLRDWVAKDDLVRFILDAVETCELGSAKVNVRGSGSAQYPPAMMLALLIYCYANRLFSSRQIEQATYSQVSVRYLCGNLHPDHDTVAAFRRENGPLLERCFLAVLQLAKELKAFGQLGTVSVDGTKLGARAGRGRNRQGPELDEEIATLQTEIHGLLEAAAQADANPAAEPASLAKELQDKEARRTALQAAKAQLEARQKASREQRRQQAQGIDPDAPSPPSCRTRGDSAARARTATAAATRTAKATINLVDPESRLMRDAHGHYLQGYNAQLVVEAGASRSQLILGARLTNEGNDRRALAADLRSVPAPLRAEITHVVADSGYDNTDLIAAVEAEFQVTVLCPPQSTEAPAPKETYRLSKVQQARRASAQAMRERLAEPEQQQRYRRRSASVEPVFGVLKNVLGFKRFRLVGLVKSQIELTLLAIAYNLRRLAQQATAAAG